MKRPVSLETHYGRVIRFQSFVNAYGKHWLETPVVVLMGVVQLEHGRTVPFDRISDEPRQLLPGQDLESESLGRQSNDLRLAAKKTWPTFAM